MVTVGDSMKVEPVHYDDGKSVKGVVKRLLISPRTADTTFAMRRFSLQPGGHTPYHTHLWEHQVYVLHGRGTVRHAGGSQRVGPGDFVFVPPMDEHQFANDGAEAFEFLCVVPPAGEG